MDLKASFDDEDNLPPYLPDSSAGSSVSSTLENESNKIIISTLMAPFFESDRKVQDNSLEIFTKISLQSDISESKIQKTETNNTDISNENSGEKINDEMINNSMKEKEFIEETLEKLVSQKLVQIIERSIDLVIDEQSDSENSLINNANVGENLTEKTDQIFNAVEDKDNIETGDITSTIEQKEQYNKMINTDRNDELQITNQINHNNFSDTDQQNANISMEISNSAFTTESSNNQTCEAYKTDDEINPVPCNLNAFSENSNEIYSIIQKQLEISLHDSNFNDANPRKESPVPATPPTNIEIDINETSSMEQVRNNTELDEAQTKQINKLTEPPLNKQLFKSTDVNGKKNLKIGSNLDKWLKELKGHVLSEFEKSRMQMNQEQQNKLNEEREKREVELCKIRRELEMTREKLKTTEANILKKNEAIENLTNQCEKQREKNDLQRVMMEWKFNKISSEKENFVMKIAEKYHSQRLKMRSLLNWHCFIFNRHKLKLEKACKKKAEDVCYELATKYEIKIKKIEDELERSKNEVEMYKDEMSKNEDYMKKALMRGVCALNMEAMSIFDNSANKSSSQTNSTSSMESLSNHQSLSKNQQNEEKHLLDEVTSKTKQGHIMYCPTYYKNEELTLKDSLKSAQFAETVPEPISTSKKENRQLAQKVKSYCEKNLNNKNMSAVSKAKKNLLKSNQNFKSKKDEPEDHKQQMVTINDINDQMIQFKSKHHIIINDQSSIQNQIFEQNNAECTTKSNIVSNGRVFNELSDHHISAVVKTTPNVKKSIKSKINSAKPGYNVNNLTRPISNLPPQAPNRSVVIEKHTNFSDDSQKSNMRRLKYASPYQTATVTNTSHENIN